MAQPISLTRDISPPPTRKASSAQIQTPELAHTNGAPGTGDRVDREHVELLDAEPTLAAVEAGQARIRDHLEYFVKLLSSVTRPCPGPTLTISDFSKLYKRNQHAHGRHFVVHQHDHPISGVHYDLRLQFSESSTISFAIPYGLPGHPNSLRPNRMAIETRVHNLWNNLIESASHATGSLLIWDTGEYEVLPRPQKKTRTTDDELSDSGEDDARSHSERLFAAFQSRHIHLRLNGTRLPPGYTIAMRISASDSLKGPPRKPKTKRRRMDPIRAARLRKQRSAPADSETEDDELDETQSETAAVYPADVDAALASEDEDEDATIRANNAYTGATNAIGSVHQRHWFLTLDRKLSGFRKARSGPDEGRWVGGWGEPFFVKGRDVERSLVTGRSADEVMRDEGVEKFVGRKMWRPIVE
ncbi:hypothetical protein LTR36_004663 [Oleoguttula mirabilis]|uniref:DNA ligase D 3'-phosphoesterase domain-containing protein n=1 Tax=Oleoguttula mirabilis TaxID=1507867 RepID=A0AAV9JF76_9PEZI|nr:hypothetical protein LTR36_004663 [Oleoguttula mirabilis]